MKVFLDDLRSPPDEGWVLVRTAKEALDLLSASGVLEVSLDNDLGDGQAEGCTVANWIERRASTDPAFRIPVVRVHSANPAARVRMTVTIGRIEAEARRRGERG